MFSYSIYVFPSIVHIIVWRGIGRAKVREVLRRKLPLLFVLVGELVAQEVVLVCEIYVMI